MLKVIESGRRQFVIPVYQRKYKWNSEQCLRLIDDIIKCGRKETEHFTGTIVYEEKGASFKKGVFGRRATAHNHNNAFD